MSDHATEQDKAANESAASAGLYVHVPFCASTCDFCAFYQVTPTAGAVERFLKSVEAECELIAWPTRIETIFWGGGTPGLLKPAEILRLAEIIRRSDRRPTEWTVELAPASVTPDRLRVLREIGVTRVSLGVQSFNEKLLEALGRQHTVRQVRAAYELIRHAGFASVNIDLMFALPGQTAEQWEEDLEAGIALSPDHISTYCLTFEEDTALWVKLSRGQVKLDAQKEADLYLRTWERLAAAWYSQYEVSNFARPGHECRHNLGTWRMNSWIGLGPSAASQFRGWRGRNVSDLIQWGDQLSDGKRATEDQVKLTNELIAEDAIVFGLRMNEGVDLAVWKSRAGNLNWREMDELFEKFVAGDLLRRDGTRVYLTTRGRLLADAIAAEILSATAGMAAA